MDNHIYEVGELVMYGEDALVRITKTFDTDKEVDRGYGAYKPYYDYEGVMVGTGRVVEFDEYMASIIDDYSLSMDATVQMVPQLIFWNNQMDKKLDAILKHLGIDFES